VTGPRTFRTTEWATVRDAAHVEEAMRVQALGNLVRHYQPALEEYLVQQFNFTPEEARDLFQGFLLEKIMRRNLLAQANQGKGKFRTFLIKAVNSHTLDFLKHTKALKRRPKGGFRSLEKMIEDGEQFGISEAQTAFDEAFARQITAEAIQRTHAYCMKNDLRDVWEILHARVLGPLLEGVAAQPYESLVRELGLHDKLEAQNKLNSAKRVFRRQFKELISEFTSDKQDLHQEINYFKKFLKTGNVNS